MTKQAFIAFGIALSAWSPAFDTGPHQDITRNALKREGFGEYPIKMTQVMNWLVDYYSNQGDNQSELEMLHFDNLVATAGSTSTHKVRVYWNYLTNNTRRALQTAATNNDPFRALSVLGMSLHAIQDFYTHSNWVETHPQRGFGYRTATWFSLPPPKDDQSIRTGIYPDSKPQNPLTDHGNYSWGMNHDSTSRPRYEDAHVFAYAATMQWVIAARNWVEKIRPGFYASMKSYSNAGNAAKLDQDLYYSYRLSEWIRVPDSPFSRYSNGHWKGEGSGAVTNFAAAGAAFKALPDSPFVDEIKVALRFRELTPNLNNLDGMAPAIEPMPKFLLRQGAVYLRTVAYDDLNYWTVDPPWSPVDNNRLGDFYPVITMGQGLNGGQRFVDTVYQNRFTNSPRWLTMFFVSDREFQLPIRYEFWDEDAPAGTGFSFDDHCDINPAVGALDLNFNFNTFTRRCTGDVNGIFDSAFRTFKSTGTEGDKATVTFYITYRILEEELLTGGD